MPLSMIEPNVEVVITSMRGHDKHIRFLENLGFVVGATISVVSEMAGDIIVKLGDGRIAISRSLANKIIVKEV